MEPVVLRSVPRNAHRDDHDAQGTKFMQYRCLYYLRWHRTNHAIATASLLLLADSARMAVIYFNVSTTPENTKMSTHFRTRCPSCNIPLVECECGELLGILLLCKHLGTFKHDGRCLDRAK